MTTQCKPVSAMKVYNFHCSTGYPIFDGLPEKYQWLLNRWPKTLHGGAAIYLSGLILRFATFCIESVKLSPLRTYMNHLWSWLHNCFSISSHMRGTNYTFLSIINYQSYECIFAIWTIYDHGCILLKLMFMRFVCDMPIKADVHAYNS